MPVSRHEVTSYHYEVRATPTENAILLFLFEEDRFLCMAAFVDGDDPLPAPREHVSGHVVVAYRRAWFADVIDMLRNEKPVIFRWVRDPGLATIGTEDEPVGEEERRGLWSLLFG